MKISHNTQEFLKELSELSKKYNIYIGGCGCCGSPYLYKKSGQTIHAMLEFSKQVGGYVVSDPDDSE